MLLAGFMARMEERLPRRVKLRELVGGKGHSGGQSKVWMVRLEEDMTEYGMEFEGCGERLHKGQRMVSTGRGGGGGIQAEKA